MPERLEEYVNDLHTNFPSIADTKYIIQARESIRSELYPGGRGTQLGKAFEKMKAKGSDAVNKQLARLTKMKAGKMKPELMAWLNKRLAILTQLAGKTDL